MVMSMNRTLWFVSLAAVCITAGADPLPNDRLSANQAPAHAKAHELHAVLAKDKDSEPSASFSVDAPKISAFWNGKGLKAGDKVRAVWMAEDIGIAERRASKITEGTVTVYKPDDDGVFSLGRPKEGWPAGKYRFELYLNNTLAETLKFTIEPRREQ